MIVPEGHLAPCLLCDKAGDRCREQGGGGPGVAGVDIILYISSKSSELCAESATLSHAGHCSQVTSTSTCSLWYTYNVHPYWPISFEDPNTDRPIAGHVNICPDNLDNIKELAENLKHEILHILGFSVKLFAFFRTRRGKPRTKRTKHGKPPLHNKYFLHVADNTTVARVVREDWLVSGGSVTKPIHMLVTPRVRREVRSHFGSGEKFDFNWILRRQFFFNSTMFLSSPGAGTWRAGSWRTRGTSVPPSLTGRRGWWETRPWQVTTRSSRSGDRCSERGNSCRGESWVASSMPMYQCMESFARMTLAVLHDSGWYNVDFNKASQEYSWGKGLGCDFVKKSCLEYSSVKNSIQPYCNSQTKLSSPRQASTVNICFMWSIYPIRKSIGSYGKQRMGVEWAGHSSATWSSLSRRCLDSSGIWRPVRMGRRLTGAGECGWQTSVPQLSPWNQIASLI